MNIVTLGRGPLSPVDPKMSYPLSKEIGSPVVGWRLKQRTSERRVSVGHYYGSTQEDYDSFYQDKLIQTIRGRVIGWRIVRRS